MSGVKRRYEETEDDFKSEKKIRLSASFPNDLLGVVKSFLTTGDVARMSGVNRFYRDKFIKNHQHRIHELKMMLGKQLKLTKEETKGLWEAIALDNAYWSGNRFWANLHPKSLPNIIHPHELFGSATHIPLFLQNVGFVLTDQAFGRNGVTLYVHDKPIPSSGIKQLDEAKLTANQSQVPCIIPSELELTIPGEVPLGSLILTAVYQLKRPLPVRTVTLKKTRFRKVYFNQSFVCTQWKIPKTKLRKLRKWIYNTFHTDMSYGAFDSGSQWIDLITPTYNPANVPFNETTAPLFLEYHNLSS